MKTIEGGITDRLMEIKNKIFCRNVYKNAKEKLSLGFWVTIIKTDTAGARFPNSIEITDSLRKNKSVS